MIALEVRNTQISFLLEKARNLFVLLIYQVYDSIDKPMFRLIYNGKIFTKYILECPQDDELCPLETFFKATEWASPEEALKQCKTKEAVS